MNNFAYFGLYIAAIMLVAALVTKLAFLIPLEVRQAKVTNGLAILRRQLLIKGVAIFLLNTVALVFTVWTIIAFDKVLNPVFMATLFLFEASAFLTIAIVDYRIYTQNYHEEKTIAKDVSDIRSDVKEVKKDVKDVKKAVTD